MRGPGDASLGRGGAPTPGRDGIGRVRRERIRELFPHRRLLRRGGGDLHRIPGSGRHRLAHDVFAFAVGSVAVGSVSLVLSLVHGLLDERHVVDVGVEADHRGLEQRRRGQQRVRCPGERLRDVLVEAIDDAASIVGREHEGVERGNRAAAGVCGPVVHLPKRIRRRDCRLARRGAPQCREVYPQGRLDGSDSPPSGNHGRSNRGFLVSDRVAAVQLSPRRERDSGEAGVNVSASRRPIGGCQLARDGSGVRSLDAVRDDIAAIAGFRRIRRRDCDGEGVDPEEYPRSLCGDFPTNRRVFNDGNGSIFPDLLVAHARRDRRGFLRRGLRVQHPGLRPRFEAADYRLPVPRVHVGGAIFNRP